MELNNKHQENVAIESAETTQRSPRSKNNSVFMKYVRPCFAEFYIVLLFVFIGVCSVGGESSFIPLVHGLSIMVLVFMAGGIRYGVTGRFVRLLN